MAERLGAVIVFAPGVSRELAEKAMSELVAKGLVEPRRYPAGAPPVNGFDDRYSGPVWYLP